MVSNCPKIVMWCSQPQKCSFVIQKWNFRNSFSYTVLPVNVNLSTQKKKKSCVLRHSTRHLAYESFKQFSLLNILLPLSCAHQNHKGNNTRYFILFVQQMHNIYEQYLFLKALLHVSMFIHHPQGVSYYSYIINKMIKRIVYTYCVLVGQTE